nr:hypothetical protein [Porphyromonas gulae]
MARENFRFGSGIEKKSRRNEKLLRRVFQNPRTAIRSFLVPETGEHGQRRVTVFPFMKQREEIWDCFHSSKKGLKT